MSNKEEIYSNNQKLLDTNQTLSKIESNPQMYSNGLYGNIKTEKKRKKNEIVDFRHSILELCTKMYYGEKDKKELERELSSLSSLTLDESYVKHKRKLEQLQTKYKQAEKIFEKVEEWNKCRTDFLAFQKSTEGDIIHIFYVFCKVLKIFAF